MLTALRVAALVEASSLLLLVANLATVHLAGLAALVGPLHGTAYLTVIATAFLAHLRGRARWLALVPGVGGLLALGGAAGRRDRGPAEERGPDEHRTSGRRPQ